MDYVYRCTKCGSLENLSMLKESRTLVYECQDKENAEEPGDCVMITYKCKDGCLQEVEEHGDEGY